eukprot:TRINITY_DN10338_c0_g2_i1.p1 TRINITY_DN10338_c0_g2~~TRINITY_DN10338_c0_g2_i1.p1  ORF type:complete len:144 (+),score=31.74 TRINITY_DN10338_c0_g2_i1:48-434(+)
MCIRDSFYTIQMSFDGETVKSEFGSPICPVCKQVMQPGKIKKFWLKDAEVDNDISGIATTCELLYETQVISKVAKENISKKIESFSKEEVNEKEQNAKNHLIIKSEQKTGSAVKPEVKIESKAEAKPK